MEFKKPAFRKLRVFAFDPVAMTRLDGTAINEVILKVPWEEELKSGPVGEYVEVIDEDEEGQRLNDPIDLNDPHVLAGSGLAPSDSNPQFHQQMMYAVAMRTIAAFEKALGRKAHWAPIGDEYTPRLKLYPHYFRQRNAYFSPNKESAFFGYFFNGQQSQFPGTVVFTCLSQDIIAHQVAHALVNGMHVHFVEGTNPDVLAFHEGFCDLVALLQHFALPEILRYELSRNNGELSGKDSQLGIIAGQFGEAMGSHSGIRNILGETGRDGTWRPKLPDPKEYRNLEEPHERGAILGRAVYYALNTVYHARVADLKRIASEGTGILGDGELHPDLINRMAQEAAAAAQVVLEICIRALDYCPAVDITFGDFLRAIITADFDLHPDDPLGYRVAFVEAFRQCGIFPTDIGNLSVEALLWPKPRSEREEAVVKEFILEGLATNYTTWGLPQDREKLYTLMRDTATKLQENLLARKEQVHGLLGEIDLDQPFEVKSIWPRQHSGPNGETFSQWVIEITQALETKEGDETRPLACCTLLVDAETGRVRYSIHKATGEARKKASRSFGFQRVSLRGNEPRPLERHLRVFSFDPSLSIQLETAPINQITLGVPWEELSRLQDGKLIDMAKCNTWSREKFKAIEALRSVPQGEYLEVVDYDAPSGCFYEPVDLHHPYLLAEDGLAPSQSVPQFHQQMVYAVAMQTIRNFERIQGRLALWSSNWNPENKRKGKDQEEFVPRLRLYPHALREANAFYSPEKKALLMGYFQSKAAPVTVFTCLSHDIITHEMTHALLDGMHRRFVEASNPDVLAFHEAFADLVALFQHFMLPEVLENQIAATRGDLTSQSRLGELAQEFGTAIGNRGALRSAIGQVNPDTGQWELLKPDPEAYRNELEPHARGALLVATVFDAFLSIYKSRAADLLRIATHGSGVLPAGNLHPDLVKRLAKEASVSARTVLDMCVRALDYVPPVDITYGDYLRAILTASNDLKPVDEEYQRVAFIEAFRRHGILPGDVRTYSLEGLLLDQATACPTEEQEIVMDYIKEWSQTTKSWNISRDREELYDMMREMRRNLHTYIQDNLPKSNQNLIVPDRPFEVHALRPSQWVDRQGQSHLQWIIEITQSIDVFLEEERRKLPHAVPDYHFRGGATLLVDGQTGRVRYAIRKPLDDPDRQKRQREFMTGTGRQSLHATYFQAFSDNEPFAILHRF